MLHVFSLYGVLHLFVFCGWLAKYVFKTALNERSFVLISMYFLQPILIFWGILIRPIDWTLFVVPLIYLIALCIGSILLMPLRYISSDSKDASILQIIGLISNTGNLGIPLGLLLFGPTSVPYTSMINLVNAIYIYTLGAYRYSRGQCSMKKSIFNVIKLPMIYSALFAIIWQWQGWALPELVILPLEMGAYSAMVLQLMIYGMFIATIVPKSLQLKSVTLVQATKYILFPLIVFCLIKYINLPKIAVQCLILQALMPIAVNNMNIAALYDCYPQKVAAHAVISTIVALFALPFII
mgnify:CR=1 FL=1